MAEKHAALFICLFPALSTGRFKAALYPSKLIRTLCLRREAEFCLSPGRLAGAAQHHLAEEGALEQRAEDLFTDRLLTPPHSFSHLLGPGQPEGWHC